MSFVSIRSFFDIGEHFAAVGRFRGKSKSGKELDAPFVHVATVQNGKEVGFRNYVAGDEWAEAWS
jgi:ketosteroid isomerase-like protein